MNEVTRTGPSMNKGKSKQDYGTPWDLIVAAENRFGPIRADLAASAENAKAGEFLTAEDDSLSVEWARRWPTGNLWLNPPYGDLYPWTEKCRKESKLRLGFILLLVPASIGTLWFTDNVRKHAYVFALAPRLTFAGCDAPYPKDCILAVFGHGMRGFDSWFWKRPTPAEQQGMPKKRVEKP